MCPRGLGLVLKAPQGQKAVALALKHQQKDVTIQCDASQGGLGATLLQEGRPVATASRALTRSEKNYAWIEKECLAIVYACEKFHYYIYGKPVKVESDDKALEMIAKKPKPVVTLRRVDKRKQSLWNWLLLIY